MTRLVSLFAFFLMSVTPLFAQTESLPSVDIKNIDGSVFNTSDIKNTEGPIVISFWATWCKPCMKELIAINELYPDWQDELNVQLYAVSVDDSKSLNRVGPVVNGRGWEYNVVIDPNGDFQRKMGVVNVPHTFVLDKTGKVVWQHTSYAPGDELELYKVLKKVANGEDISH